MTAPIRPIRPQHRRATWRALDEPSSGPGDPPRGAPETRWGLRLVDDEDRGAPEPVDSQPLPPLRERLRRAAAVPAIAAAAIFMAIVLVSIVTVWLRPHAPEDQGGEAPAASSLVAEDDLGGAAAAFATEGSPAPAAAGAAGSRTGSSPTTVFVHVVGEVRRPGVYELERGERVAAAIQAAGGTTEAAAIAGVNLARVIADGEQIAVPDAEGRIAGLAEGAAILSSAPGTGAGSDGPSARGAAGPLNLNTADAAMLEMLPRVGPALAQRILDWRESNGGFASVEQLLEISGIGQKTFEQLREQVTV